MTIIVVTIIPRESISLFILLIPFLVLCGFAFLYVLAFRGLQSGEATFLAARD